MPEPVFSSHLVINLFSLVSAWPYLIQKPYMTFSKQLRAKIKCKANPYFKQTPILIVILFKANPYFNSYLTQAHPSTYILWRKEVSYFEMLYIMIHFYTVVRR